MGRYHSCNVVPYDALKFQTPHDVLTTQTETHKTLFHLCNMQSLPERRDQAPKRATRHPNFCTYYHYIDLLSSSTLQSAQSFSSFRDAIGVASLTNLSISICPLLNTIPLRLPGPVAKVAAREGLHDGEFNEADCSEACDALLPIPTSSSSSVFGEEKSGGSSSPAAGSLDLTLGLGGSSAVKTSLYFDERNSERRRLWLYFVLVSVEEERVGVAL